MSDKNIKIALVSGSKLFLEGLRKIIANEEDIEIIGECSLLKELNAIVKEFNPEVLFIDNREAKWDIEKLFQGGKSRRKKVRVILFSDAPAEESENPYIVNVNEETTASELIYIIKNRSREQNDREKSEPDVEAVSRLTKTEFRIIKLIASGVSNKDISDKLSISEKTVKAHISNIFEKLNMKSRYQLMVFGRRTMKNNQLNV